MVAKPDYSLNLPKDSISMTFTDPIAHPKQMAVAVGKGYTDCLKPIEAHP